MLGDIVLRLYDETPIHRDNFLKLAKEGYYDGTLFHRVIKDFMIQGGDPDSKGAPAGKMLGVGDPGYTLEAEIKDGLFHKRGALAAARQGDEERMIENINLFDFTLTDEDLREIRLFDTGRNVTGWPSDALKYYPEVGSSNY